MTSNRKEYNKSYYLTNREKLLASQKLKDSKRKLEISKVKAEYYKKTSSEKRLYVSNYRKTNPGKVNALNAKHRAAKRQATPPWLTKQHWVQIEMFYNAAAALTKETGIKFEVDHIIPLTSEYCSGLHVPWNLQIMTKQENCSKGNKV